MEAGWTCPSCGRAYDVEPKWCGCRPYPLGTPSVSWFVFALSAAEDANLPFELTRATLIARLDGPDLWHEELEPPPKDQVARRAHQLMQGATSQRAHPAGSTTGWVLIRERCEPHVEALDQSSLTVVDLSEEEYAEFLRERPPAGRRG